MQNRGHGRDTGTDRLLTAAVTHTDSAVIVTASGEIDLVSIQHLQAAIDQAIADPAPVLVVDLSEVGFIGSTGLAVLLAAHHNAAPRPLRIVASPQARRPIEVTGLAQILTVYPDRAAALSDLTV
ncbi:STAS domain-containing protein [Nocardia sp. NPDC051570]|uniref:STAS domain-containing protein n=1 Tax=Nocardia sp. NPDC051570 TaxID=3364324 RepID=UPI00379EABB8